VSNESSELMGAGWLLKREKICFRGDLPQREFPSRSLTGWFLLLEFSKNWCDDWSKVDCVPSFSLAKPNSYMPSAP
jgi:hypothetical protein